MFEFLRRNQVLLTAGFFLLFSFALLTANRSGVRRIDPLGSVFLEVLEPLQNVTVTVLSYGGSIWSRYLRLVHVEDENRRLTERLRILEAENHRASEIELQNQRLQELLEFRAQIPTDAVAARVTGKDASGWFQTVTIDRGDADGIRPGMAVVCAEGVVGRIAQTSRHAARVLLISDHNSGVDALTQRTRARGIVEGSPNGACAMKYIKRTEDVDVGDVVVTSGLDGIFPKGLLVGRVTGVTRKDYGLFQVAVVVPMVEFSKLEEVLVVTSPPPDGDDSVGAGR